MQRVATRRDEIYNYFRGSVSCQPFFFAAAQEERYAAYYTSMYLLQDTTESLIVHRPKGFSSDPFEAYIEFWGVMQALFIQQDSIFELYEAVTGSTLDTRNLTSWHALRNLSQYLCWSSSQEGAAQDISALQDLHGSYLRKLFGCHL